MIGFKYVEDPILGKGRAEFNVGGGTGGTSYVGGTRIAIGGETISFVNSATIQNVTGTSVTLEPDTAYKITATASAVTLNANVPAAGSWAYEGHAEIFVAGTGYIVTGANVVLANPLEPDAVNNCVLRFHDGTCIIDVEDHVYGYIVTSISGTTQGTLHYGITSATSNYIAFDATTNGSIIDLSGSTASVEKHIVGNGYSSTTLTGAVDCGTSKFTVANLGLSNVQVTGGTMTLGDAYIPSGSTVAVSGGGLAVEKVTGDGGVINPGGTNVVVPANTRSYVSGVRFSGATGTYVVSTALGQIELVDCVFSGNQQTNAALFVNWGGTASISGCTFDTNQTIYLNRTADSLIVSGSNATLSTISGLGKVTISSGAILDLTGNTNATPIAPGGGIVFESGGATVLYSSGAVSGSYMMDNVTLPAGAKLTNTAVVDMGGGNVAVRTSSVNVSGATFTNGSAGTSTSNRGGAFYIAVSTPQYFTKTTISGNKAAAGGGITVWNSATCHFTSCAISGNVGLADMFLGTDAHAIVTNSLIGDTVGQNGAEIEIIGNDNTINTITGYQTANSCTVNISSGASINLMGSIEPRGGIQVVGGTCTVNGVTVEPGAYTSIVSSGGSAVINQ